MDKLSELKLETQKSPSSRVVEHLVVSSDGPIPHIRLPATREHGLSHRQKLRRLLTCFCHATTATTTQQEMTH